MLLNLIEDAAAIFKLTDADDDGRRRECGVMHGHTKRQNSNTF